MPKCIQGRSLVRVLSYDKHFCELKIYLKWVNDLNSLLTHYRDEFLILLAFGVKFNLMRSSQTCITILLIKILFLFIIHSYFLTCEIVTIVSWHTQKSQNVKNRKSSKLSCLLEIDKMSEKTNGILYKFNSAYSLMYNQLAFVFVL